MFSPRFTRPLTLLARRLIDRVVPQRCALCLLPSTTGYCPNCQSLLPWLAYGCRICAAPLPPASRARSCGQCQAKPPDYVASCIPFHYRSPIADHIHALKYRGQLHYAVALSHMLADNIAQMTEPWPDVIIPIPLHWRKIARRGFNQSSEISRVLSRRLGLPLHHAGLIRVKNTRPQTGLAEKTRRANIRNAFQYHPDLRARNIHHVALVDDVVTSGSTVRAAARVLVRGGVQRVTVWALAKT